MTVSIKFPCDLEQLRVLASLQSDDACLWDTSVSVETAYVQQHLRILTQAIEGKITFEHAYAAIQGD